MLDTVQTIAVTRPLFSWEWRSYADHLTALSDHDRASRFLCATAPGYGAQHAQRAVNCPDTTVIGWFDGLTLIGVAEICYTQTEQGICAEAAYSVANVARGCGIGAALVRQSVETAIAQGAVALTMSTMATNRAMLSLARKVGGVAQRHGPEVEISVTLTKTHAFAA